MRRPKLSFKSLLAGIAVVFVLRVIFTFIAPALEAILSLWITDSFWSILIVLTSQTLVAYGIGGYVAANIAPTNLYFHSTLAAVISLLLFWAVSLQPPSPPSPASIFVIVLGIAAAAVGGLVASRTKNAKSAV